MNIGAQLFLNILNPIACNIIERTWEIPSTAKMNQLKRQPCAHRVTISLNEIQLAIRQAPNIQLFAIHLNTP
jgi:hypothetical protein